MYSIYVAARGIVYIISAGKYLGQLKRTGRGRSKSIRAPMTIYYNIYRGSHYRDRRTTIYKYTAAVCTIREINITRRTVRRQEIRAVYDEKKCNFCTGKNSVQK